ncbi:MAG TPA: enoyl-CoA hydratase-related protein [Deinococcales bacterium]|nr:enoyl-CoA hydratase-related protein [Deinococcales bacterium]
MSPEPEFEFLTVEVGGPTATITLNRPKALNALSSELLRELADALDVVIDDPETQTLIVTGAGERAFAAGADITEFTALEDSFDGRELSLGGQDVMATLANLPIPTIAAIHGFALGGGLELALACDLRVADPSARLGLPEVGLGLIPGFGGTQRLPRLIGAARALELIFTARQVTAEEALAMGLVNRVAEDALQAARDLADQINRQGPVAVGLAKEAVRRGLETNLTAGLEVEADLFGLASATKDRREGVKAFQEKRPPRFRGE